MNAKLTVASSLLVLLVTACGGQDSAPPTETHSCFFAADGLCAAETGVSLVDSGWNADCTAQGGTFGTGCPTANRVGTCTKTVGTPTKSIVFYGPPYTAATGQQACMTLPDSAWTSG